MRWIALFLLVISAPAAAQEPRVANESLLRIRVGIHTYASDGVLKDDELQRYQTLFRELAANALNDYSRPIYIQAAAGSYADIYDWCKNDMIDFAIVTAGVYAKLKENTGQRWMYLCTMGQGDSRDRFEYGIQCAVHEDSQLSGIDDIRREMAAGNLDVFMVSRLSTSGGIFPRAYLKQQGLPLDEKDITYTGTHDNCLRELVRDAVAPHPDAMPRQAQQGPPAQAPAAAAHREQIAFVWDGAFREGRDEHGLPVKSLPLPGLAQQQIPESAVIVRREFYDANDDFYNKLLARSEFRRLDDYAAKYQRILDWSREFGDEQVSGQEGSGWEELFAQLVRHKQETQTTPRVALVLAGGGAKCAYQVGVAQVLEEKFQEFRKLHPSLLDCDISLVVGTSGGAINALPVAMGTYGTQQGVETIQSVWSDLDAREILLPEPAVRIGIGLTISFLYALAFLLLVRLRLQHRTLFAPEQRAKAIIVLFWGIGGAHLLWSLITHFTGWKLPWGLVLGDQHTAYVMWAIAAAATWIVGALLMATGTVIWLLDWQKRRGGHYLSLTPGQAREAVVWLVLLTIVVGCPIMLAAARHFSASRGLEQMITRAATELINERLDARGREPIGASNLRQLSSKVLAPENKLLEKDLIITATVLKGAEQTFGESDVYFYAAARDHDRDYKLQTDKRFIDLDSDGRQNLLLEAILGSGAVFPFFPARTLDNCPKPGESIHLVDGSFGHHVPIEAAIRWGATHIFIVDPTPPSHFGYDRSRSLLQNSQIALGHLFEQAQKVDRRAHSTSGEERPPQIYRVNPEATRHQISLLSFASLPIERAIKDAADSISTGSDRFLRQLSPPYFLAELDTLAIQSMR